MASNLFQSSNPSKDDLGGVIFGCTHETMKECLVDQLFGLPGQHMSYVKNIEPGLPLFLFNYSDRKLHGIFEAETCGQANINPHAWSPTGSEKTKFPAQVRIRTRLQCEPLVEKQFKPIIQRNYFSASRFNFELDNIQASTLISLFEPSLIGKSNKGIPKVVSKAEEAVEVKDSAPSVAKAIGASAKWVRKGALTLDAALEIKDSVCLSSEADFSCIDLPNMDAEDLSVTADIFEQNQSSEPQTDVEIENEEQIVFGMERLEDDNASAVPTNMNDELSTSNQSIIHQLIRGTKELKVLSEEQLQKMSLMETNLADSKLEIQQLKGRLQLVESRQDPSQKMSSNGHLRGERIFLVGGWDGHSELSDLHDYSPSTDDLRTLQPMSTTRIYAAAAPLVGQICIFGGATGSIWNDTVESYNPQSDEWMSCPPLSVGKGNLAGVTLHGKLFAIGGGNGDQYLSDVEMFDPDLGRWIQTTPMLEKRVSPASATLYGALYTAGGYNGEDYLKSVERFDPRTSSWEHLPSMNTKRGCHSLVAFNGKLYAIGGYDGNETVSSMEALDPRFGSWTNSDPMNLSRAYAGAVVFRDSIYLIGGVKCAREITDTVECYKADSGWSLTNSNGIGKRCFFPTVVL